MSVVGAVLVPRRRRHGVNGRIGFASHQALPENLAETRRGNTVGLREVKTLRRVGPVSGIVLRDDDRAFRQGDAAAEARGLMLALNDAAVAVMTTRP